MAALVGLCYAELVSMFPRAGADYVYAREAFGERVSFVVGWLVVVSSLVAAAAVALGFGGYLGTLVDADRTALAAAALVGATLIAFAGVREAVWVSIVLTLVELAGLVLVIVVGIPELGNLDLAAAGEDWGGVLAGASLVVFAFVGFEQIASLAEETVEPERVIPRAMLYSIGITTVVYLLVALAAVAVLGAEELGGAGAPLARVAEEAVGTRAEQLIAVVAVGSTANTLLLLVVAASRLIYGMADVAALPRFLAWVHPGVHTPARAILLSLAVGLAFVVSGDIAFVAGASNVAVLVAFASVSLAVVVLRFRQPGTPRPFRLPAAIGRVPLVPLGAIACVLVLLAGVERDALLVGGALLVAGVVAMEVLSLWRPHAGQRQRWRQRRGPGRNS